MKFSAMSSRNRIHVTNLPVLEGLSLSDKLQIYFGRRSNGGGDIDDIQLESVNGHPEALITFAEEETVRSVLMKEHVFYGKELKLKLYPPLTSEPQAQERARTSENLHILSGVDPQQNVKLVMNRQFSAECLKSVEAATMARFGFDEKTTRPMLTGQADEVVGAASMLASSRNGGVERLPQTKDIGRIDEQGSESLSPSTLAMKNLRLVDQEHGGDASKIKSITQRDPGARRKQTTCKRSRKLTNGSTSKSAKRPRNSVRFDQRVLDYMNLCVANHQQIDEIRKKFMVEFQTKPGGLVEVNSRDPETNPQNIQWAIEALEDLVGQTKQLDLVTEVVDVARQFTEASSETLTAAVQQALKSTQVLVTPRGCHRLEFFGTAHDINQEMAKLQQSVLDLEPPDEPHCSVVCDEGTAGRNISRNSQESLNQPGEKDVETLDENGASSSPLGDQKFGSVTLVPDKSGHLTESASCSAVEILVGHGTQYLPPCGPERYSALPFGTGNVRDEVIVGQVAIPMETTSSTDLDDISSDQHEMGNADLRSQDGDNINSDKAQEFQLSSLEAMDVTPEAPTISNSVARPLKSFSDEHSSLSESSLTQVSYVYIPPDAGSVNATEQDDTDDVRETPYNFGENEPSASAVWDRVGSPQEEIETEISGGQSVAESALVTDTREDEIDTVSFRRRYIPPHANPHRVNTAVQDDPDDIRRQSVAESALATDTREDEIATVETFDQLAMPPANSGASFLSQESASRDDFSITLKTGMKLVIRQGDLTDEFTGVIISSADPHLRLQQGVSRAIRKAAGPELVSACQSWVQRHGPVEYGKAVWTTGGNLMCSHMLHVVLPGSGLQMEMLKDTIVEALKTCTHRLEASVISMPALGAGRGASKTMCAHAFFDAVLEITRLYQQGWMRLDTLVLVDHNEATVTEFRQVFNDAILSGGFLQDLIMWDGEGGRQPRQASWAEECADNAYNEMASADPWKAGPFAGAVPRPRPKAWKARPKPKPAPAESKPDNQCPICLEEIKNSKWIKCGHRFCRKCIDRWLAKSDSCPYCKQKV